MTKSVNEKKSNSVPKSSSTMTRVNVKADAGRGSISISPTSGRFNSIKVENEIQRLAQAINTAAIKKLYG